MLLKFFFGLIFFCIFQLKPVIGLAFDTSDPSVSLLQNRISNNFSRKYCTAIQNGFSKAFVAIIDANLTTLAAAAVLFFLGVGSIKGFAVCLSIGILTSMFTALVVSKFFVEVTMKFSNLRVLFKTEQS